jgi:hypothetical protein
MWTNQPAAARPVEKLCFSPESAHSANPLHKPLRGVIPVVHTLYDYDKGIS